MKRITANQYQTSERYYKLPKILWENERYKDMKLEEKVAYSFLKDRLELSLSNGWIDEDGSVYLVYSNPKLMELLGCSKSKLLSIKKALRAYGLIEEVQQSSSDKGNLANKIYLGELESDIEIPLVLNSDQGGVSKTLGGSLNQPGVVLNSATNETEYNELLDNSSRKAEENPPEKIQEGKYIQSKYYSLLQVIVDKYNDRYSYPHGYRLTHEQKMMIGQYLESGYVRSDEILNMIDRIPRDCESPLAYLLRMLQNLKLERQTESG
ncbi:replication initiator protein A [Streptococcus cuniculi]|uniref:Replication initiator protein A n=1 Tax=Streptococcus cuniculi TaxID=1432788 RepID=A0A4Y9J6H3_9STRE|nr:replication initiator protein A [Streptococcus cuniculi]MBF0779375.1 replication initiator protein A [Streptococcus cuniculi]TFU96610.1 replication initiator protein A [Streptococcus cuniculi]